MITVIDTGVAKSKAPTNATVRAGDTVYTVHIPKDPRSGEIISGGIEVQMRQALSNLVQALSAAGGSIRDVAQVVVYLTDKDDFQLMNSVYTEFFSEPYPSRATVVVKDLMGPIRVELVVHAYIPGSRPA